MLSNNLEAYLEKNRKYINEIASKLALSIPEEPVPLINHVNELIVHKARISILLAEMNSLLDLAEYEALIQKTKSITELDRVTKQKQAVRDYRMWRDILYGLMTSIDSTRNWAQSALAFEKTHALLEGGMA